MQKSSQEQESERYLARKISKSHFYFKKNPKKSEGLQGNFSGGSQNSLKKSLFFVQKNLKKSFFCSKKSQKVIFLPKKISKSHFYVNQMRRVGCRCGTFATQQHVRISECCKKISGWVADAVPLQHSCVSQNLNYKRTNEVFYRCSACVLLCV